jgi:hypothetical protein
MIWYGYLHMARKFHYWRLWGEPDHAWDDSWLPNECYFMILGDEND